MQNATHQQHLAKPCNMRLRVCVVLHFPEAPHGTKMSKESWEKPRKSRKHPQKSSKIEKKPPESYENQEKIQWELCRISRKCM
jgi:hypothetical protein